MVAAISHLPQVVASLLMLVAADHAGADGTRLGRRRAARYDAAGVEFGRDLAIDRRRQPRRARAAAHRDGPAPRPTPPAPSTTVSATSALFDAAARARRRLTTPL